MAGLKLFKQPRAPQFTPSIQGSYRIEWGKYIPYTVALPEEVHDRRRAARFASLFTMKTEIVRYEPKYRQDVREIVFIRVSAAIPVEPFYDDLESFADMNSLYYTDCDDRHNFMALADGKAAGYLLGCRTRGCT